MRPTERAREAAGEAGWVAQGAVTPSAQLRARRRFVTEERRALEETCWRRLIAGAVALWNVDDLMSGGEVTRSWEKERLSEECGPKR